jgi:hypothetical protein
MSQSNDGLHTIAISSDVVQLGLAAEVGGLRLGAAARGTIARDDMTDLAVDPGGSNGSETIEEHRGDRIEGAFGVGLGGDETFLDLTFEVTRERFETAVWDSSYRGLAEVDIDGLPEIRFGGAVRVGFPGPWRTRLQLVGSFSDRTSDVNLDQTRTDSLRVTVRRDEYGHLWRGGLTVSADVRESSLTFYSLYVNQDGPTEYERLYSSYLEYHRTVDVDEVHFGMALRRDFWWETRLLVGIQNRFTLRKNRIFRIRDDERRDYDATTTEVLSRNFAWGLRRSFESLELTGAMRTDLSAGDLFLYLDVLYRL